MELHPTEALLIQRIRNKYRFGTIEITLKDGLPVHVQVHYRDSLYVEQQDDIIKE